MQRKVMLAFGIVALTPFVVSTVRAHGPIHALGVSALAAPSSSQDEPTQAQSGLQGPNDDAEVTRAKSARSVDGQLTAEYHRARVTTVINSLLLIAEREDPTLGLSERLKVVAHELQAPLEAATEAMEKTAYRGRAALFFGTVSDEGIMSDAAHTERTALDAIAGIGADMTDPTDSAALDTARDELLRDMRILDAFTASHLSQ